jgi:predicted aspartyl protease
MGRSRRALIRDGLGLLGVAGAALLAGCSRLPLPSVANAPGGVPLFVSDYRLPFCDVQVNGHPARALLDSGGSTGIQLASTFVAALGLQTEQTPGQRTRLDGSARVRRTGRLDTFALGDEHMTEVPFDTLEGDVERIAAEVGTEFQVILGWRFFAERTMLLDYPGGRLWLSRPGQRLEDLRRTVTPALILDYDDQSGLPLVAGQIADVPVTFLVDTGAPFSTLDRELARTLPAPIDVRQVPLRSQMVPLEIRDVRFGQQPFALGFLPKDLTSLRPTGARGVLGNSLLINHPLFIDPFSHKILLRYAQIRI